eukprot:UN26218
MDFFENWENFQPSENNNSNEDFDIPSLKKTLVDMPVTTKKLTSKPVDNPDEHPESRRFLHLAVDIIKHKRDLGLDMTCQWPRQEKVVPRPLTREESQQKWDYEQRRRKFDSGGRGRGRGR